MTTQSKKYLITILVLAPIAFTVFLLKYYSNPKEENPFLGYWVSNFYTEYDNDTIDFYFHEDYLKIKDQFYQYKFYSTEITISTFDDCHIRNYHYKLKNDSLSVNLVGTNHSGRNLQNHSFFHDVKEQNITFIKHKFNSQIIVPDYANIFIEAKPCNDSMLLYGTWVDTFYKSVYIIDTNLYYKHSRPGPGLPPHVNRKGNNVYRFGSYSPKDSRIGYSRFYNLKTTEFKFIGCSKIGIYKFGAQDGVYCDINIINDDLITLAYHYRNPKNPSKVEYMEHTWIKALDYPLKGDDKDEIIIPGFND